VYADLSAKFNLNIKLLNTLEKAKIYFTIWNFHNFIPIFPSSS